MVFILALLSCDQENLNFSETETKISITQDVSIINGVVSFRSIESYTDLIENQDRTLKRDLVQKLDIVNGYQPFKSLKGKDSQNGRVNKSLSAEEVELIETNDFITTLINSDGLIQIGEYIFKIDLQTEKCFVLESRYNTEISDLVNGNTQNEKIMTFSTNDDVLYLLADGSKGTQQGRTQLFCTQSGARAKDHKDFDYESDRFRMDNKIVYQKVAVYFSLQAKTKVQYKSDAGIWVSNSDCGQRIRYFYRIKPKCKSTFEEEDFLEDDGCGNELNLRPYERSYGINKYWFTTRFYGYSFWSREYEIKDGY